MSKNNYPAVPTDKIVKSLTSVFKTKNIENLTNDAYKFLCLMSGFIAHYDLHGFRSNYSDLKYLVSDILHSPDCIDPERMIRDKWFEEHYGYAYCKSKSDTFKAIAQLTKEYEQEIEMYFTLKNSADELAWAGVIAEKNGYKLIKQ